jgi:hypothetical protein
MAERFDNVARPDRIAGATIPKETPMGQKIELIADIGNPDAPPIAVVESSGINGSDGVYVTPIPPKHGTGHHEAVTMVNDERPGLRAKLGRDPNGDELIAAVLDGPNKARFRKVAT